MGWSKIFQVGLSVVAILVLAWWLDWQAVVQVADRASPSLILLCLLLYAAQRFLMAGKWLLLLRVHGVRMGLLPATWLYSAATLAGSFLPATVGGDAMRVGWLWRSGVDANDATASIMVERIVGAFVTMAMAVVGMVWLGRLAPLSKEMHGMILAAGVVMAAIAAGLAWSWFGPARLRLALSEHRLVGRILARFRAAWQRQGRRPEVVAAFAGLTLVESIYSLGLGWLTAHALGIEVRFVDLAAAYAVALAITRLPITIDGIGVYEGIMALLLATVAGLPAAESVALILVGRILFLVVHGTGALLFAVHQGPLVAYAPDRAEPAGAG
ncbi:lysylphosphatidylglycerol synthase transmembrane domain-containing protein [Geminicoccus harenae]|uniref:lysylphosphatidylglycerol synthase transmembrane domain-containing protein n=1 Tax=Geminicoccus harenae TaxID=2498453 RepID=UPI00168B282E|nr:lysylphosphatidylglycerol synthase transmembrane domain-containing protein [Geminicoccus harenae]